METLKSEEHSVGDSLRDILETYLKLTAVAPSITSTSTSMMSSPIPVKHSDTKMLPSINQTNPQLQQHQSVNDLPIHHPIIRQQTYLNKQSQINNNNSNNSNNNNNNHMSLEPLNNLNLTNRMGLSSGQSLTPNQGLLSSKTAELQNIAYRVRGTPTTNNNNNNNDSYRSNSQQNQQSNSNNNNNNNWMQINDLKYGFNNNEDEEIKLQKQLRKAEVSIHSNSK